MRPTYRAWAAAIAATGAGAGLLALGQPGPALALATAGIGTGLLVTERSAPADRAAQAASGGLEALASLTRGLGLEGRAIMVPPGPGLAEPRCFLPARLAEPAELPPIDDATVVHRAPPGVLGLALPPPGIGLLRAWREEQGWPSGQGVEEAAAHVPKALAALGVGSGARVERAPAHVRVRFEHTLLAPACSWSHAAGAPWHLQGMCPTCSMVHGLVALAAGKPVRVEEAALAGTRATLVLGVGASSPA